MADRDKLIVIKVRVKDVIRACAEIQLSNTYSVGIQKEIVAINYIGAITEDSFTHIQVRLTGSWPSWVEDEIEEWCSERTSIKTDN